MKVRWSRLAVLSLEDCGTPVDGTAGGFLAWEEVGQRLRIGGTSDVVSVCLPEPLPSPVLFPSDSGLGPMNLGSVGVKSQAAAEVGLGSGCWGPPLQRATSPSWGGRRAGHQADSPHSLLDNHTPTRGCRDQQKAPRCRVVSQW